MGAVASKAEGGPLAAKGCSSVSLRAALPPLPSQQSVHCELGVGSPPYLTAPQPGLHPHLLSPLSAKKSCWAFYHFIDGWAWQEATIVVL